MTDARHGHDPGAVLFGPARPTGPDPGPRRPRVHPRHVPGRDSVRTLAWVATMLLLGLGLWAVTHQGGGPSEGPDAATMAATWPPETHGRVEPRVGPTEDANPALSNRTRTLTGPVPVDASTTVAQPERPPGKAGPAAGKATLGVHASPITRTLPVMVGLYSRLLLPQVVNQRRRRLVLDAVRDTPNVTCHGILARTRLSESDVRYHVRVLERHGIVKSYLAAHRRVYVARDTLARLGRAVLLDDATAPLALDPTLRAAVSTVPEGGAWQHEAMRATRHAAGVSLVGAWKALQRGVAYGLLLRGVIDRNVRLYLPAAAPAWVRGSPGMGGTRNRAASALEPGRSKPRRLGDASPRTNTSGSFTEDDACRSVVGGRAVGGSQQPAVEGRDGRVWRAPYPRVGHGSPRWFHERAGSHRHPRASGPSPSLSRALARTPTHTLVCVVTVGAANERNPPSPQFRRLPPPADNQGVPQLILTGPRDSGSNPDRPIRILPRVGARDPSRTWFDGWRGLPCRPAAAGAALSRAIVPNRLPTTQGFVAPGERSVRRPSGERTRPWEETTSRAREAGQTSIVGRVVASPWTSTRATPTTRRRRPAAARGSNARRARSTRGSSPRSRSRSSSSSWGS